MNHPAGTLPGSVQVARRRQVGWRADQPGEHGGFRQCQFARGFVEIALGCPVDTVGAGAEIDLVEVSDEDRFLAQAVFEPERDHCFLDFAFEGAFGGQEHQLGKLLGDRATALPYLSRHHVDDRGARNADGIEAEMVVEAMIFDGYDGLGKVGRNILEIQDLTAEPAAHGENLAIVGNKRRRDL